MRFAALIILALLIPGSSFAGQTQKGAVSSSQQSAAKLNSNKTSEIDREIEIFRSKAKEGNVTAQRALGIFLCRAVPDKKPGNFEEGISWLERAVKSGDARSASELGKIYEEGKSKNPDLVIARKWYEKAASLDAREGDELARFYEKGIGGPKDPTKAIELYMSASKAGSVNADFALATFYQFGQLGLKKDCDKGKEYLDKVDVDRKAEFKRFEKEAAETVSWFKHSPKEQRSHK